MLLKDRLKFLALKQYVRSLILISNDYMEEEPLPLVRIHYRESSCHVRTSCLHQRIAIALTEFNWS
jgi:hypothetical protein